MVIPVEMEDRRDGISLTSLSFSQVMLDEIRDCAGTLVLLILSDLDLAFHIRDRASNDPSIANVHVFELRSAKDLVINSCPREQD